MKCILPRGRDREDQKIRLNKVSNFFSPWFLTDLTDFVSSEVAS